MRAIPWAVVGFVVGAAVGFAWAKSTRSRVGENVRAEVAGGVLRVEFDAGNAAEQGLRDAFQF